MKKQILFVCVLLSSMVSHAEKIDVTSFRHVGPYQVNIPFKLDTTDVNSKTFTSQQLLDSNISLNSVMSGKIVNGPLLPSSSSSYSLNLVGFRLENTLYTKGKIKIEGLKDYQIYVDGVKQQDDNITLEPSTHDLVIKYLSQKGKSDSLRVSFETEKNGVVKLRTDNNRLYNISDVLHGMHFSGTSISPNGKYLITNYNTTRTGGQTSSHSTVTEISSGNIVATRTENIRWMPSDSRYYYTRKSSKGLQLVTVSPATGHEKVEADNIPEGYFTISPNEEYLLYTLQQEGPKEKKEIYQVLQPYDRQPGWRNRSYISKYDLKTGVMQQLTFGYNNVWTTDVSADGTHILFMTSRQRLTARPTTLFSIYRMNVKTLNTELLVDNDGFISDASFSPDGNKILITGSPECLGSIGSTVPKGRVPSMVDNQMYIMNLADRKITPLTRNFNPNVQSVKWNRSDNYIYFTAENLDFVNLYRLDPSSLKIEQINVSEDIVRKFSVASSASIIAYYGQSASNSDRMYLLNSKTLKSTLREDLSKEILANVQLGECHPWNFISSGADTIYGRYYLPPHFDASKKYPMIVNYYGGCSPTSRNFESRYPHHAYAALGYIVYVIEPSGATGFGQEFSSRHVNTAGSRVAEDIIEGTNKFVEEHSFVDAKKIGCIGASYGGFMTQYLQTKTDIFAAAISHAGISDHTSYWGEGYWGYSYSEVSMANSYPWTDVDLFVKQSPLFNADKIHTPLLFLHGAIDMNVPVGESIQMFTALKLLGRETAMVLVDGQDHHIVDYGKRIQWQNTIFAWFAKWLQNDDTWWNAIYKPKNL